MKTTVFTRPLVTSLVAALALSAAGLNSAWADSPVRYSDDAAYFDSSMPYRANHQAKKNRSDKHRKGRKNYAKVMRSEPVLQSVSYQVPQQQCWTEQVRYSGGNDGYRSNTSTLLGGIIGAAIGNNLGRKHHQDHQNIQTVAGGLLGAAIGRDIGARHQGGGSQPRYQEQQRCSTEYQTRWEQKVTGYDVTYRFRGETYHTRMDYDPGDKILVNVHVRPVI